MKTLTQWLQYIQHLHPNAIKLDLIRIKQVADHMGITPTFKCPVVMVAGTNGKGSTIALLAEIYKTAGFDVGAYTSPHIFQYNERVQVNGECISDDTLCQAFNAVETHRQGIALTFFEFFTLAALRYLQQQSLDVILLEVGLGGRLDAVNIIDADIAVITSIDIDHTDYLGDTRRSIAKEKIGILRAGKVLVCGDIDPPETISTTAKAYKAHLYCQQQDFSSRRHWRAASRPALPATVNSFSRDVRALPITQDYVHPRLHYRCSLSR